MMLLPIFEIQNLFSSGRAEGGGGGGGGTGNSKGRTVN